MTKEEFYKTIEERNILEDEIEKRNRTLLDYFNSHMNFEFSIYIRYDRYMNHHERVDINPKTGLLKYTAIDKDGEPVITRDFTFEELTNSEEFAKDARARLHKDQHEQKHREWMKAREVYERMKNKFVKQVNKFMKKNDDNEPKS